MKDPNHSRLAIGTAILAVITSGFEAIGNDNAVPTITAKTLQKTVAQGTSFDVEIVVENVSDLAVVQFKVITAGGDRGALRIEDINVEKQDPRFAFGEFPILAAVDRELNRAGLVQLTGGQNIDEPAYLATVTVSASDDAAGTFHVSLEEGEETFLRDADAIPIEVAVGNAATITVAERAQPTKSSRTKR